MAERFLLAYEGEYDQPLLLIPVPLTPSRRCERGYNQAQYLAESLQDRLLEKGVQAELDKDVLQKHRETKLQKQASSKERLENVEGAYHVHKRTVCKGRTILLVDDIMTTGATGSECAKLLLSAGAREVIFLTATALPEEK